MTYILKSNDTVEVHLCTIRSVNMQKINNVLYKMLYNTLFSKSEFEIFSREDIFANTVHAKISSRENNFPRKYLLAEISSREYIFLRFFSVPQICRLVGVGYAV